MVRNLVKLVLCLCVLFGYPVTVFAQNLGSSKGESTLGVGIGLPYGGLGMKMSVNPADQFTLFAGGGYNLVGFGTNFGAQYIFPSKKRTEFLVTGMYGYNTVVVFEGSDYRNYSFNGPSAGLGFRVNSARNEGAFWDFGLLVPFRSQAYKNYSQTLKNSSGIEYNDPWPVLFFFGRNFPLSARSPKQRSLP
jgi:hypothetical protein